MKRLGLIVLLLAMFAVPGFSQSKTHGALVWSGIGVVRGAKASGKAIKATGKGLVWAAKRVV